MLMFLKALRGESPQKNLVSPLNLPRSIATFPLLLTVAGAAGEPRTPALLPSASRPPALFEPPGAVTLPPARGQRGQWGQRHQQGQRDQPAAATARVTLPGARQCQPASRAVVSPSKQLGIITNFPACSRPGRRLY